MKFSDTLQSFSCWDELIETCQGELRFVDDIRGYFTQRKKLEEEYAEQIRKLDVNYTKLCQNNPSSYFSNTWLKLLSQSTNAANAMSKNTHTFDKEIIPEIVKVSEQKKQGIAKLIMTKNKLLSQMSMVGSDVAKLHNSIEDFAKATEINKTKYLDSTKDDRNSEYSEKYKQRFVSNAAKLQEYNNDYNILLNVVSMHESSYIEHIIPAWLEYHQHILTNQINDLKCVIRSSFEMLLHHDTDNIFTMLMAGIYSCISKVNFESEYTGFSEEHGTCPELTPTQEEYSTTLQRYTSLNLPIKQLIVNELTHVGLNTKLDAHKTDLLNIDEKLDIKTQIMHEIETKSEKDLSDDCKKYELKAQIHELHAQRCRYQMTVNFVNENLLLWQDKPLEPFFKLLPVTLATNDGGGINLFASQHLSPECLGAISPMMNRRGNTLSRIRQMFSLTRPLSTEMKDLNIGTPVEVKSEEDEDYVVMTKDEAGAGDSDTPLGEEHQCSKQLLDTDNFETLQNQSWFYNDSSRQETIELLQYKGQFLVRKTVDATRRTAVLVLSVNTGGSNVKHFIMQISDKGQFRLEGAWFNSIPTMLNYHITTEKPITTKSLVVIRQPVLRDRWNLMHRDIRLKQFLGQGNFGDVYQAQLQTSGREVAVKTCRESQIDTFRDKFVEEAETLKKFSHKNVVKLLGICCDEVPYYIVMEYMNNGSLLSVLQEGPLLPIKQLVHYCEQAAAGMVYLHSQNYIHRDLAARNCLVHSQTLLKISDFGMSRYQEKNSVYISKMKQIPIRWTAPECLMFRTYTFKSDIWSYGILMWEIYNKGAYPYSEMSNRDVKDQLDAGYRLPKSRDTPGNIYQIMLECWKYEPKSRPTFEDIHSAVKNIYIEFYTDTHRYSQNDLNLGSMSSGGSRSSDTGNSTS